MKMNSHHPTFLLFLDTMTKHILTNIKTDVYFSLNKEKKKVIQYLTLKMILQLINVKVKLTKDEFLDLLKIFLSKNEENEHFELSGILYDIINDFESLNEKLMDIKKPKRIIKIDKTPNE